jgi:uncharacterized protein (DUF433 family)
MNAGMNERIEIDPEVQHGKPVVRGTRVPVARILVGLAGGMTYEEIGREYDLTVVRRPGWGARERLAT